MLTSQKTLLSRKSNIHPAYYGLLRGIVPTATIPMVYAGRTSIIATSNRGPENMGLELFLLGVTASIGLAYFYCYLPQFSRWWQANRTHKSHETDKVKELQEGEEKELELEEQSAGRSRSSMSSEWPFWSASLIFQKLNPKWILCFLAMASKPKWKREAEALSMEEVVELMKKPRPDFRTDNYGYMLYSVANTRYLEHRKVIDELQYKIDCDSLDALVVSGHKQLQALDALVVSGQENQRRLDAIEGQVGFLQESSQEHWQALDALAVSNREHWQELDALQESSQEHWQALDAIRGQVGFLQESSQEQQQALDAIEGQVGFLQTSSQGHWQALDSLAVSSQENRENLENLVVSSYQQQQELNSLEVTVAVIRADVERFVNREVDNIEPHDQNAIVPQQHRNRNWLDNFLASRNAPRGHNSRERFPDQ